MVNRKFSELSEAYQTGCHVIEKQCRELLNVSKIKFDDIYWDKLNLLSCHLYVKAADKKYSVKFGKKALIHQQEVAMQESIMVRLKVLAREMKFAR